MMRWLPSAREGSIIGGENGEENQKNQLNSPIGTSFDRVGNLYVFDSKNNRVQGVSVFILYIVHPRSYLQTDFPAKILASKLVASPAEIARRGSAPL